VVIVINLQRIVLCIALLSSYSVAAEQKVISINIQAVAMEQPSDYFVTLLKMALEASKAPDEQIELRFAPYELSQARWIYLLQHEASNTVIWTMTTKEREALLRPIRIPLFKGLFGKRVFIIRKQDQPRFDKVTTRAQLGKLLAGQGVHWPDTRILQLNNLPVTTASSTDSLFKMLMAGRFDYFPRGISEAWFELAQRPDDEDMVVEKNLMIVYPTAIYYFVPKSREALAVRIERGLERLIDSGEFDKFFYSHARTRAGLEQLKQFPRRIITLENPDLPEATPLDNPRYWLTLPES
jgi:hypothetical protein